MAELAAAVPEMERSGPGLRAGFVVAAAGVAALTDEPEPAARWLGAAESVGAEKGPFTRYLLEWQIGRLRSTRSGPTLEEALRSGRAEGIDAAFADASAWCTATHAADGTGP